LVVSFHKRVKVGVICQFVIFFNFLRMSLQDCATWAKSQFGLYIYFLILI